MGDDILSVVETLKPARYILIGHSSGGYAVLNAAVKADKGLIGIVGVDSYRGKLANIFTKEYAERAEKRTRVNDEELEKSMRESTDGLFHNQIHQQ